MKALEPLRTSLLLLTSRICLYMFVTVLAGRFLGLNINKNNCTTATTTTADVGSRELKRGEMPFGCYKITIW